LLIQVSIFILFPEKYRYAPIASQRNTQGLIQCWSASYHSSTQCMAALWFLCHSTG